MLIFPKAAQLARPDVWSMLGLGVIGSVPRNLSLPLGPEEGGEARIIDNYQCIGGHIA